MSDKDNAYINGEPETHEDEGEHRESGESPKTRNSRSSSPEPPARYAGSNRAPYIPNGTYGAGPEYPPSYRPDSDSACKIRNMIAAAQIMALVSFIIGGVILSAAALVVAVFAYRKVTFASAGATGEDASTYWALVKRSATIALVLSGVALAVNAVSLMLFYPMFMQMLQSNDYAWLFGEGYSSGNGSSSTSSIWG